MWKYVSRRVKDTIELSINVRKSFTIQQSLNNSPQQQQQQNDRKQNQHRLYSTVAPRHQDPSRDKDKSDEKFKKKYHRLNNNNKCFLNALTWVRSSVALTSIGIFFISFSFSFTVNGDHNWFLWITTVMFISPSAIGT